MAPASSPTLVSVIVPVYRVEGLLRRCVDSILTQTHQNLQVILVDDGSPDGSGWICDDYALADRRVLVIHQENAGLSAARNAGLDEARGEFTTFVDADDWIAPDMVSKLLWLASSHHAEIAIGAHWKTTGDATSVIGCVNGGDNTNELLYSNVEALAALLGSDAVTMVVTWGKLYKTALFAQIRFGRCQPCWVSCWSRLLSSDRLGVG